VGEKKKIYKISYCQTCMNRLHDLKETLHLNIEHNKSYPFLEFVILDYNSIDGLGDWIRENMMDQIESGRINYYRTEEPIYFSMSHSRNIAFKVAKGEIVNNLDVDNYTFDTNGKLKPEKCWAACINNIANQHPEKNIFTKSKQRKHGRIGFFKNEFIDILGGYDEDLEGYGWDDHDLVDRAILLGFTPRGWGGSNYFQRIWTGRKYKNANMKRNYKETEKENKIKSKEKIDKGILKANEGKHWGKATLIKNFKEEIKV
jgi:hypothetical protein